jgi:hypothetical protein
MIEKRARDLAVGDIIYIREGVTFTIEGLKPSPLTGWGAPVLEGKYSDGRYARIDTGANERIADHIFSVIQ